MTAALGGSRLGDAMSAVRRGLGGRTAALSLAVLAIMAGAATYAWLAARYPPSQIVIPTMPSRVRNPTASRTMVDWTT